MIKMVNTLALLEFSINGQSCHEERNLMALYQDLCLKGAKQTVKKDF